MLQENDSTILVHELMTNSSIPNNLSELVRCKCKKNCNTKSCSCRRENLSCTDGCFCNESDQCENTASLMIDDDDLEDGD